MVPIAGSFGEIYSRGSTGASLCQIERVYDSVYQVITVADEEAHNVFDKDTIRVTMYGSAVHMGNGLFMTNQHVVTDSPRSISVRREADKDSIKYPAEVIWSMPQGDVAVIYVRNPLAWSNDGGELDFLPIGEPLPLWGEQYWAVGFPLSLTKIISTGLYSGLDVKEGNAQIGSAVIGPGNSGGPGLVCRDDVPYVIGLSTWMFTEMHGLGGMNKFDDLIFSYAMAQSMLEAREGVPPIEPQRASSEFWEDTP